MSSRRRASLVATIVVIATTSHPTALRPPRSPSRGVADADAFSAGWNSRATRPRWASPRSHVLQLRRPPPSSAGARAAGRISRRRALPLRRARKIRAVRRVSSRTCTSWKTQGELQMPRRAAPRSSSASGERRSEGQWQGHGARRATNDAEVTGSNPARVAIDDDRDPSGRRFKVPALVVEKASIDEACVQLPAKRFARWRGSAPTAGRSGRSSNLVSGSSCPSAPRRIGSPKLPATWQARQCRDRHVGRGRRRRVGEGARGRYPGCGGVGVAM